MPQKTKLTRAERIKKFGDLVTRIYHNTAPLLVAEALLFSVVAVFMIVRPLEILNAITFVVGGLLIVFGLYRTSMGFVSNLGFGIGVFDVFFGLVTMIWGIVFCVYPHGTTVGIMYVFIVMFLLAALRMLFFALNMIRVGFEHYWIDFTVALGMLVLSLILLFIPNIALGILVWCIAIYLLIYAIADIYMFWKLLRLRRATQK